MKTNTQKLVFAFFILNTALFSSSFAQVVYTDVVPDTTIDTNGGVYALDLNNDGIPDFNITYSTSTITGNCAGPQTSTKIDMRITPLDSNEVGRISTSIYPGALLENVFISSATFTWIDSADQVLSEKTWRCSGGRPPSIPHWVSYYLGNWNGANSKFLALRVHVGLQTYYGWLRMNVASGTGSFTILDYAYNTVAGQFILSGEPMPRVQSLPAGSFCPGSIIGIPFYASLNYYHAGNKFIAQLSDSAGSFSSPLLLDSVAATASDTIFATLPVVSATGNGYKIRILSTDPEITGLPSTDSLSLIAPPGVASIASTSPVGLDSVCANHGSLYLYAATGSGYWHHWYLNGVHMGSSSNNRYVINSGAVSGVYTVVDSNQCGIGGSSLPFTLFVGSPLNPAFSPLSPVCTTAPPFLLTGGMPPGGVYSGPGVNSATSMLDPSLLAAGIYTISYTVQDSIMTQCQATATRNVQVNVCTGLEEHSLADAFVYSNGKQLAVHLHDGLRPEGTCTVYNTMGQEIRKAEIIKQVTEFDLSDCSSGIYFVVMQNMNGIETRKVFLQ